ncbi:SGNH/GDSL hydrolase family protein [Massilia putida]|uniref:SGNH/GDSL hydrolase family protein n=1 Tax=Massilia putida TaxID=1141883 RepID=UPI001475C894|nr:SGNH/GDSL hydrolase family protein [Massilia putida]
MTARALATLLLYALLTTTSTAANQGWRTGWSSAPDSDGPALPAQTLRQVVRTSAGGTRVRIRLSNLFGKAPLTVGAARVGLSAGGAHVAPGSDRALLFGGRTAVTIAAGSSALSDPVDLAVGARQQLAVSLYLPAQVDVSTVHGFALQTAYLNAPGDATRSADFPSTATDDSRYFISDVEVMGTDAGRTLAIVGDSIADGVGAGTGHDARWPDALAARLQGDPLLATIGIANGGIAGNRVLNDGAGIFVGPSALSRFGRDALDKPGVRWILVHEGVNDITATQMLAEPAQHVTVEQIEAGLRTLAERAHARGIRIWAGTLMPLAGTKPFYSEAAERQRQAVNAWIRTAGVFDSVIDFDAALRDPLEPTRLNPAYDSGDHLHPNEAGYRLMAQQIDLRLLNR